MEAGPRDSNAARSRTTAGSRYREASPTTLAIRADVLGVFTSRPPSGLLLWKGVSLGGSGLIRPKPAQGGAMRSNARIGIALLAIVVAGSAGLLSSAATAAAPTLVTNDNDGTTSYLRYDGTSDATTTACSSGRRSQNEPTVAVNPSDPDIVV